MRRVATRRLRIFIAHPSEMLTDHLPNGDGLVCYSFIRRLAERGHELHVAAQRVDLRHPLPGNVRIHQLTGGGISALDRLWFMVRMRLLYARLQKAAPFDVIHQMNPVFTGLSLSLVGVPTPLVLGTFVPHWDAGADAEKNPSTFHPVAGTWHAIRRAVARMQQSQAAGLLLACPQAVSRVARPDRAGQRIFDVPHGIDLSRFQERTAIPTKPSVLFLTSVIIRKGIFTLLDAFPQVAARVPGASLVIAGHGHDLDEVRRRVANLPGCDITILGPVPRGDIQDRMRAHSVYCLPSHGEPLATTVLEAMACGVPVVSTNAGGMPDIVSEKGGRLVPPRDPAALAEALVEILCSPSLQQTMGRHNRLRVETVFEAEKAADALEAAYEVIVSPQPVRAGGAAPRPSSAAQLETELPPQRTASMIDPRPLP